MAEEYQYEENGNPGDAEEEEDDDYRKVFVGGLSQETAQNDLKEYFDAIGSVTECILKTDSTTGRSRGFAFVVFKTVADLEKVMAKSDHHLHGRTLEPKRAKPRKNLKVFIGGLPTDTSEDQLRSMFEPHGKIVEISLPTDENGKRRGFAFVQYETDAALKRATNPRMQMINGKECEVKRSIPKPDARWGFDPRGGRGGFRGGMRGGRGRGGYDGGYGGGYGGYGGGYGGYGGGYDYSGYGGGYGQGYGGYGGYDQSGGYGGYGGGYDYSGYGAGGYGAGGYGGEQGEAGGFGKAKPRGRGGATGYTPY